jgi:hypothetical protein
VADPRVFGESTEKIGKCSGGRAKGGRARQGHESLASQRRRLVSVLTGGPRVAEQDGLDSLWLESRLLCSGGRANGGNRRRDKVPHAHKQHHGR